MRTTHHNKNIIKRIAFHTFMVLKERKKKIKHEAHAREINEEKKNSFPDISEQVDCRFLFMSLYISLTHSFFYLTILLQ